MYQIGSDRPRVPGSPGIIPRHTDSVTVLFSLSIAARRRFLETFPAIFVPPCSVARGTLNNRGFNK